MGPRGGTAPLHRGRARAASLADVALHGAFTPAAGDVAAPVVLAVTPLHHAVRVGVIAAPTAHEVAAVTAVGGFVALPGGGNERSVSVVTTSTCLSLPSSLHPGHCGWPSPARSGISLRGNLPANFPVFTISSDGTVGAILLPELSGFLFFFSFF